MRTRSRAASKSSSAAGSVSTNCATNTRRSRSRRGMTPQQRLAELDLAGRRRAVLLSSFVTPAESGGPRRPLATPASSWIPALPPGNDGEKSGIPDKVRDLIEHELRADRAARLRPLFSDRPRHRAVCPAPRHPVPGARLGRQFGRLLLPRHHRGRSRRASTCCSSASSAPRATSRPTSTSISSTSGARR